MTSRERFTCALNHKEGDRVPIDFGQDVHNGIHERGYSNLQKYLGDDSLVKIYEPIQHLGTVKPEILERFGVDTRYIFAGGAEGYNGSRAADSTWVDEWGVKRITCGLYDESIMQPLAGLDYDQINKYKLPDPRDPHRFIGLKEHAKYLYENTDYALIGGNAASLFYLSSELIGFQEYCERIIWDTETIEMLVDRLLEWCLEYFDAYLDEVGEYIQMIWMGDDWGTQIGPFMSPQLFRNIFIPRYKQFTSFVKSKANVKIALHSCGSVFWAMEDFAKAGIDVLHPVQATAKDMGDAKRIKNYFGNDLVFYSNIANQTILPNGTPEELTKHVQEKIEALAPGGGYIFSAGHNIQADVPPQNIIALFDAAQKYGKYPIESKSGGNS